jgi:hypothetical protein
MKLLHALYFRKLPLTVHFDFFKKLVALVAAAGEDLRETVAALMLSLNAWLAKEDAVTDWIRKSAITQQIAATDAELTRMLVGINNEVAAGLHSFGSAIVASAEKVHTMIKSHGNVASEPYDEKAADTRKLLEQFAGPYAHDVDNLGIGMWVQYLQLTLNKFNDLLRLREDEQMAKPPYTSEEVRKGIEGVYHEMMKIIEANAVVGTSADFLTFINKLNPDIDRLNEAHRHAQKDISVLSRLVIATILTQIYTGQPIIVIPEIYYIDDNGQATRMWLGKDFEVSYRNNTEVGTAEVIIHGKGDYTGQATAKFNIARKPLPTEQ